MTSQVFEEKVNALRGTLYRVSCAYLSADADRADAVQEALLKAWQGKSRLKHEEYFETWLVRILIRECVNIGRDKKRVVPMEELPEKAETSDACESIDLREAILRLAEPQRVPIVLFYMEGYDVERIAKTLRLPRGTVLSRLSRAREAMKKTLRRDVE